MSFNLGRFASKPARKRAKDGTEYVYSPSLGQYVEVESVPELPEVTAKLHKREKWARGAFAVIPLWWARRAHENCGKYGPPNTLVCVELFHRRVITKSESFVMPAVKGVGKKVKLRSLRGLEEAELITVEWRRGRSPVITFTPFPVGNTNRCL
jgi:hypothetical protein